MEPVRTSLDGALLHRARETVARAFEAVASTLEAAPEERITIKLLTFPGAESRAAAWVEEHGGEVVSRGSQVLVVNLPTTALPELDRTEWLRRAEAPHELLPQLDEARGPASGLDVALARFPLTGKGVVVGVIDSGVDWSHPDFHHPGTSQTRLEYFLFAHRQPGTEVSVYDSFTADQINGALQGTELVPQGDLEGHGTHCASIAAGNGQASGGLFRGVAPEATLMGVRSEPLLDTHIIKGIREIFDRAGSRPCVINLSLGGHLGPHDGTSGLENVISRESGRGRIIVAAAGNDGDKSIHWHGVLEMGSDLFIPVLITDDVSQFVDVWIPRGDEVDPLIQTPDGVQTAPDGSFVQTVFGSYQASFRQDPVNRDQNLRIFIQKGLAGHVWLIRLVPTHVSQGIVHAWSGTARGNTARHLFPGYEWPYFSIAMPATEERAIVVGSFVSRSSFPTLAGPMVANGLNVGQLSPFSAHGPTRYGALKPDIVAPGQYVTAALAAGSRMATDPGYVPRHSPAGPYVTIQGTSMAAPFVCGLIALLLEREPDLTPEEVQQRLRVTARRDDDTQQVWNPGFGFGKLDVEAMLEEPTGLPS
jgi:subtilisin family serine protease